MSYIIKSIKPNRLINLGCRNGLMLMWNPQEIKGISESTMALFREVIEAYISGGFLEVVKKVVDTDLDINQDGKVDYKDRILAKKVLKSKDTALKNILKET